MTGARPAVGDEREVDVLMELIQQRYGGRLTSEQLADVRGSVQRIVADVRALRAVPLHPADEPAPPFVPFRAEP